MKNDDTGSHHRLGFKTRTMAFRAIVVFLAGTLLGSILPESGNFLATYLNLSAHQFNPIFLVIGIIGVVLACFTRQKDV